MKIYHLTWFQSDQHLRRIGSWTFRPWHFRPRTFRPVAWTSKFLDFQALHWLDVQALFIWPFLFWLLHSATTTALGFSSSVTSSQVMSKSGPSTGRDRRHCHLYTNITLNEANLNAYGIELVTSPTRFWTLNNCRVGKLPFVIQIEKHGSARYC